MLEQTLENLQPIIELFGDSPWVKGLMVILISQLAARFVAIIVNRGIRRLTSHTKTDLDDQVITLIHRPLMWSVMLLGVMIALVVAETPANIQSIGRSAAVSLMILLWMIFTIRLSKILLHQLSERSGQNSLIRTQTLPLFTNLASIIVIALGIRVKVSVAYGSDIDQVRDLLMQVAEANQKVCGTPEHRVRFRSFGSSGLVFELLCWIDRPELRGRLLDQLYSAVYKTFNKEGIEIPYDKQDLYIKEMPGGKC